MSLQAGLISVEETARILDVSVQHVRRLADSGEITKVARGLIDRASLDRYLGEQRRGRTRSWAEHTAWGAVALLSGQDAPWLGSTQTSRVRRTLRELAEPADLLVRTRDRARVHIFAAHSSALHRLRKKVATVDLATLEIVDVSGDGRIDGYLDAVDLDATVHELALTPSNTGNVTLRVTALDFNVVAGLVASSRVVAALDAATSVDPRTRGVGEHALREALDVYR